MVVESHLVVVDVEKESMPLKQEKNGLTKDKYMTCSRTLKKNGNREANLTRFPRGGLCSPTPSVAGMGWLWSPSPHFGVAACTPCSFTAPSDGIPVDILLAGKGKL